MSDGAAGGAPGEPVDEPMNNNVVEPPIRTFTVEGISSKEYRRESSAPGVLSEIFSSEPRKKVTFLFKPQPLPAAGGAPQVLSPHVVAQGPKTLIQIWIEDSDVSRFGILHVYRRSNTSDTSLDDIYNLFETAYQGGAQTRQDFSYTFRYADGQAGGRRRRKRSKRTRRTRRQVKRKTSRRQK
jgi:hypothetical protein